MTKIPDWLKPKRCRDDGDLWSLEEMLFFEDAIGVLTVKQMATILNRTEAEVKERIDLFDLNPNKPHPLAAPPGGEATDDFDPTFAIRRVLAARVRLVREMAGLEYGATYLSTKAALTKFLVEQETEPRLEAL